MGKLEKLQTEAAERFLQTALIVDDRASVSPQVPPEQEIGEVTVPAGPNFGDTSMASGGSDQAPDPPGAYERRAEEQASVVNVKDLADRFADLGLTCGILKPIPEEENAQVTDRIAKAARGVDIVVIDWMLDDGFTAMEAVTRIVTEEPKGRRLLAVYTTQRQLDEISDQLLKSIPKATRVESDDLALDVGGIRIVIYHKGGPTLDEAFEAYLCPAADLPEKLVEVFASQTAGLVPAVALSALAATRENTHRLLRRLHQDLDLGYVGHLLLQSDREEGKQHLLDAISGEFRAVVEDDADTTRIATKGYSAWLTDHKSQLRYPNMALKALRAALADKEKKKAWREKYGKQRKLPQPKEITTLLVNESERERALDSDAGFAQLMAMRRPYSGQNPSLHLGAIVREQGEPNYYWLCIQPVCDSVRLGKPTNFLMLPLDSVQADTRASFVVTLPGDDGKPTFLHLWDKSFDLELMRLTPNHKGKVVFKTEKGDGPKAVTTVDGIVLTWVAQLKPAHASRVAHEYGARLSRVGLDESEWLRLLATDQNMPQQRPRTALVKRIRS